MNITAFYKKYTLILVSVCLLIWLFARQNWQEILQQFQSVQLFWIIPILAVTVLNHLWRALRWRLLLATIEFEAENTLDLRLAKVFRAVMIGYFVNLALPRVGELARIWVLQKNNVWQIAGTVIVERLLDIACLFLIILLFLATNQSILQLVWNEYFWIGLPALFIGLLFIYGLVKYLKNKQYIWWEKLQKGLQSIRYVRRQGWLWLYTALLWWSYVAMSYYWFFALPATAHLGWQVAFAMLALGTLSRVIPLQANSAGVYHTLVVWALGIYGIPESTAFALTLLIHTTQLLFTLFVGGFCVLLEQRTL